MFPGLLTKHCRINKLTELAIHYFPRHSPIRAGTMCIIAFNVQKLTREGEVNFNQLWFSSIWAMYWFAGTTARFV